MDRVCTFLYKGKPLVKPGEIAHVVWSVYPAEVRQDVVESLEITRDDVKYHFKNMVDHKFDDVFADANSAWQAAYGRYYARLEESVKRARETLEEQERLLKETMNDIKKEAWKNG